MVRRTRRPNRWKLRFATKLCKSFFVRRLFKGRNPWGKRGKKKVPLVRGSTCNLSDVEQQGDALKKSTKLWTLQTWMAGDDDGDWTMFGGSQQSLPWCCGLMDAISSGAYRIHPGSFREGQKKFKPNEGWPHLGRDDVWQIFGWTIYIYTYIYIYVFVFCLCMLIWQCCRSCSCVQVDACVDAFLDGHAFAGRIHAKLGRSVQGFIFNPTWMSQELSKLLVNGL